MDKNSNWPQWPIWREEANDLIHEVSTSGRWTIRGKSTGKRTMESKFCEEFSEYIDVNYSLMTTSGSKALELSLESMGVQPGDEVIVPAMTWIAPVTSVLNVGAIPILVDVDVDSCISKREIAKSITEKTKAVIAVHLHCNVANMDEITRICNQHGLKLLEDCSQAHGALWKGKQVGTFGDVSVFSLNQEKTLTCGEGGIIATNSKVIYENAIRIRNGGAEEIRNAKIGEYEMKYEGQSMCSNEAVSEFQAAVALSQLPYLENLNRKRRMSALYLNNKLLEVNGVKPFICEKEHVVQSYYEYGFLLDEDLLAISNVNEISEILSNQLGFDLHPTDSPVYRNEMFAPESRSRYAHYTSSEAFIEQKTKFYPVCEYLHERLIVFHHSILLSDQNKLDKIISCIKHNIESMRRTI